MSQISLETKDNPKEKIKYNFKEITIRDFSKYKNKERKEIIIETIPCIECEGIEDAKFEGYITTADGYVKEKWLCLNCGQINMLYREEDLRK